MGIEHTIDVVDLSESLHGLPKQVILSTILSFEEFVKFSRKDLIAQYFLQRRCFAFPLNIELKE